MYAMRTKAWLPRNFCRYSACWVLIAIWSNPTHAMEPAVGMVEQPCPPPVVLTPELRDQLAALYSTTSKVTPADRDKLLNDPRVVAFNEANRRNAALDWPGLCRYRADNANALAAPVPPRVVFMGDSITEFWVPADPGFFQGGIVGRGISGQTSAQMLVRFQADVVALRPKIVHILAGTNDVAGNAGPTTAQDYKNQIKSMVEIARANGIAVILGSIPPAAKFPWRPEMNPAPRIAELNKWLREYAAQKGIEYVDYFSAMAGPSGELPADLSPDGVHPNGKGYAIMRRLVESKLSIRTKAR